MFNTQQPLVHVDDARRGYSGARVALTNELRPHLERIVRRVLRRGPSGSPLEIRIHQVAQSLGDGSPHDPAHSSAELVSHLCRGVVARMCGDQDSARPCDTRLSPTCDWATALARALSELKFVDSLGPRTTIWRSWPGSCRVLQVVRPLCVRATNGQAIDKPEITHGRPSGTRRGLGHDPVLFPWFFGDLRMPANGYSSGKVLIAEAGDALTPYAQILRAEGYNTEAVNSGEIALAKIRRGDADVALVEDDLSDRSALELLRAADRRVPIILCAASWNLTRAVQAMKEGAWDYLPRPMHHRDLLQAVSSACRSRPGRPNPAVSPLEIGRASCRERV